MGILLILLGLAAGAAVADFAVENHIATAPDQAFNLFGSHWHQSLPEMVLAGAVLGALAVVLIALGFRLLGHRMGKRRTARAERRDLQTRLTTLQGQTVDLESRNTALAGENEQLRSRLDALELDGLRSRLDSQAAREGQAPEASPAEPAEQAPANSS